MLWRGTTATIRRNLPSETFVAALQSERQAWGPIDIVRVALSSVVPRSVGLVDR